jgi:hypothetical protein
MIIETVLMIIFTAETLPPLPTPDAGNFPVPCVESGLGEVTCWPVDDSGK